VYVADITEIHACSIHHFLIKRGIQDTIYYTVLLFFLRHFQKISWQYFPVMPDFILLRTVFSGGFWISAVSDILVPASQLFTYLRVCLINYLFSYVVSLIGYLINT
jgi:hypothetical protein